MAKLSGVGSADYSNGIEDVISAFASTSGLTDDFKVIIGATSNSFKDANAPVSISTTLTTADHITALNHITGSADHTGTVTATITAEESELDDITGTNNILSITATDGLSISEYEGIKATTTQAIQFSNTGSITDSINTLYNASGTENRHDSLHEAITGDNDMNIVVSDLAITSNWAQVNAIAGGDYDGTITATLKGTAAQLTNSDNASGWSNFTSAKSNITFEITSGNVSAAQLAILAGDTSRSDISTTDGGGLFISDSLGNLITDNGTTASNSTDFATALSHTDGENISLNAAITVAAGASGTQDIRQLNKLISSAEGGVTASITDHSSNLLLTHGVGRWLTPNRHRKQ